MSLSEAYTALRAVPPPVRELFVELVYVVLASDDPEATVRKAVDAVRPKPASKAPPPKPAEEPKHYDSKGFEIADEPHGKHPKGHGGKHK